MKPGDRVTYFKRKGHYTSYVKMEVEILRFCSSRALVKIIGTDAVKLVNIASLKEAPCKPL